MLIDAFDVLENVDGGGEVGLADLIETCWAAGGVSVDDSVDVEPLSLLLLGRMLVGLEEVGV